jgi:hypothetical protein
MSLPFDQKGSASLNAYSNYSKISPSKPRGRPLVISSSLCLLHAFVFVYQRLPAVLVYWTIGQQAFNGAMILLLDALETGDGTHIFRVEQTFVIFCELESKGVHNLAGLAKEHLSWGLECWRRKQNNDSEMDTIGNEKEAKRNKVVNEAYDKTAETYMRRTGTGEIMRGGVGAAATETGMPPLRACQDAVMGNIGMLLLEDPGLQSSAPEPFAPLSWNTVGASQYQSSPIPPNPKQTSYTDPTNTQNTAQSRHYYQPASSVQPGHTPYQDPSTILTPSAQIPQYTYPSSQQQFHTLNMLPHEQLVQSFYPTPQPSSFAQQSFQAFPFPQQQQEEQLPQLQPVIPRFQTEVNPESGQQQQHAPPSQKGGYSGWNP